MTLGSAISKLRTGANLSQEQFAAMFHVSQQSVQKWESGESVPELNKIIKISKQFGVSLDALILGNNQRMIDEMKNTKQIKPQYTNVHDWESYSPNIMIEYRQSLEEGLDIEEHKDVFDFVSKMPNGEMKKKFGDILFETILNAKQQENYKYVEPSDLEGIKDLRKPHKIDKKDNGVLEEKIRGAWIGRICGCMLGKTVESIRTDEFIPFLKETENYPMHRYIYRSDLNEEIINKYKFPFASMEYADEIDGMPSDDDTNYVVLAQEIIEKYGKDFTPYDVSRAWLDSQKRDAYYTAERVAFCNFIKGFVPPQSAIYKNPYREWIGGQIRTDYYGYINPGNPEKAAEMAWRDVSVSHIKNGIYGGMLIAAMISVAGITNNIEDIIWGGLAEIPYTSRLYEAITAIMDDYKQGVSQKECFAKIHRSYDEHDAHNWCHTIPNAMIVVASLLYGGGDYSKSICMAVEAAFDTDCNGATVGSILGMANGIDSIPEYWLKPMNDTLHTDIFGVGTVKVSDRVDITLKHITI